MWVWLQATRTAAGSRPPTAARRARSDAASLARTIIRSRQTMATRRVPSSARATRPRSGPRTLAARGHGGAPAIRIPSAGVVSTRPNPMRSIAPSRRAVPYPTGQPRNADGDDSRGRRDPRSVPPTPTPTSAPTPTPRRAVGRGAGGARGGAGRPRRSPHRLSAAAGWVWRGGPVARRRSRSGVGHVPVGRRSTRTSGAAALSDRDGNQAMRSGGGMREGVGVARGGRSSVPGVEAGRARFLSGGVVARVRTTA